MNLKSSYRRAANGGLCIGFEYSKGEIWNPELQKCEPVNVRLDVTISAVERNYYYDNEELDAEKFRVWTSGGY